MILESEEKSSPETKLKGEPEYGGWTNELKLEEYYFESIKGILLVIQYFSERNWK